jgi:GDP-4-dehydro-6-deoxy-D-mannose reductase
LDHLITLSRQPVEVRIDPARMRPVDQPLLVADASKLRIATRWEPVYSMEQTLVDMLDNCRSGLSSPR